ncbi:MAG: molybdopterin molybdotransferase MoeA [Gammaproteobacteria bacterium]|nr:molybdopterin molybdotransferase MoeA [Gammaproteobacteria bacterium]
MNKHIPVTMNCNTDNGWLSVDQARARMCDSVKVIDGFERVALRAGLNRMLAQDVISPINVPPYDNSAMDGYAVRAADLPASGEAKLKVIGSSFAGTPFDGEVQTGETVRIMTGAQIPQGADTVIMQEQVQRTDDAITIGIGHRQGQNVRYIGEDIQQGGSALQAGKKIGPAELGLLASLGIPEVTVKRKLRVAFFSTGDELRAIGEPLAEGQIYDSNRYTLYGMLTQLGVDLIDMGVIPDVRSEIENAFTTAASLADAVITSGGVSVGEADYVKETLDKLGEINFWKISMKPGKPLAFGKVNNAVFIGLPGNPVSVMATFYQFALPALRRMMGQQDIDPVIVKVPCKTMLKKQPGRTDFQRGVLSRNDKGELVVDGSGMQASHILSGMSHADCFIILPAESGNVEAGTLVDVQPFAGLLV